MYDLQPATAALQEGTLNAFSSIAGRLLDAGQRSLEHCAATRRELSASLDDSLPGLDPDKAGATLHRHSRALGQECLEALLALQEESMRFFQGHSHGLSAYVARSMEKAGQGLPAEALPAMELFRKSVANLDQTLGHLTATAAQTASHIENTLARESAPAKGPARRRQGA